MEVDQQRGKKREREESTTVVNGTHANGLPGINGHMNGGANGISNGVPQQKQISVALNSKAGTGNVRPRPIKKQRMVHKYLLFFLTSHLINAQCLTPDVSRIFKVKQEISAVLFSNSRRPKVYRNE